MSGDVVERLRAWTVSGPDGRSFQTQRLCGKAADLITSQAAEIERLKKERDEARALALTAEMKDSGEAWEASQRQLHRLVEDYGVSMFDACYLGQLIAQYGTTKAEIAARTLTNGGENGR